jgi:hypothetical protein
VTRKYLVTLDSNTLRDWIEGCVLATLSPERAPLFVYCLLTRFESKQNLLISG